MHLSLTIHYHPSRNHLLFKQFLVFCVKTRIRNMKHFLPILFSMHLYIFIAKQVFASLQFCWLQLYCVNSLCIGSFCIRYFFLFRVATNNHFWRRTKFAHFQQCRTNFVMIAGSFVHNFLFEKQENSPKKL